MNYPRSYQRYLSSTGRELNSNSNPNPCDAEFLKPSCCYLSRPYNCDDPILKIRFNPQFECMDFMYIENVLKQTMVLFLIPLVIKFRDFGKCLPTHLKNQQRGVWNCISNSKVLLTSIDFSMLEDQKYDQFYIRCLVINQFSVTSSQRQLIFIYSCIWHGIPFWCFALLLCNFSFQKSRNDSHFCLTGSETVET